MDRNGMSCPPGQARPAADETGLWWTSALALRSVRSWCHEPVYELDPEPPAHPTLSPGLWAGARILEFDPPGLPAGAVRNGRRSWMSSTHAVRGSTFIGTASWLACAWPRPAGGSALSRLSQPLPRSWSGFQNG